MLKHPSVSDEFDRETEVKQIKKSYYCNIHCHWPPCQHPFGTAQLSTELERKQDGTLRSFFHHQLVFNSRLKNFLGFNIFWKPADDVYDLLLLLFCVCEVECDTSKVVWQWERRFTMVTKTCIYVYALEIMHYSQFAC